MLNRLKNKMIESKDAKLTTAELRARYEQLEQEENNLVAKFAAARDRDREAKATLAAAEEMFVSGRIDLADLKRTRAEATEAANSVAPAEQDLSDHRRVLKTSRQLLVASEKADALEANRHLLQKHREWEAKFSEQFIEIVDSFKDGRAIEEEMRGALGDLAFNELTAPAPAGHYRVHAPDVLYLNNSHLTNWLVAMHKINPAGISARGRELLQPSLDADSRLQAQVERDTVERNRRAAKERDEWEAQRPRSLSEIITASGDELLSPTR